MLAKTAQRIARSLRRRRNKARRPKPRVCQVENLERRELMTASVNLVGTVLEINGTWRADEVEVAYHGRSQVKVVAEAGGRKATHYFSKSGSKGVKKIAFKGGYGDDKFTNNTHIKSVADGGANNDTLIGGSNHDTLIGGSGNDTLHGGKRTYRRFFWNSRSNGNDTLEGGAGNDTLEGGQGHDTYRFSGEKLGTDKVVDRSGVNTLDFSKFWRAISIDLAKTTEQRVSRGHLNIQLSDTKAVDHVFGTWQGDRIVGNSLGNKLVGGGGDDLLTGRQGRDTLEGGAGDDDLYGQEGNDSLNGGSGNDYLDGGTDNDTYKFTGSGFGRDTIAKTTAGINTLDFRNFKKGIRVDLGSTHGGQAVTNRDTLVLKHAKAVDNVIGTAYNDLIRGNDLVNRLEGRGGDDDLDGGKGRDRLIGGTGYDSALVDQSKERVSSEVIRRQLGHAKRQKDNWSCGPNSASRFLQAYGHKSASVSKLKSKVKKSSLVSQFRMGTTPKTLRNAMRKWRKSTTLKTGASFKTVTKLLKQGKPVIALIRLANHNGLPTLHYVTLDGIDTANKKVLYTDTNGKKKDFSYGQFKKKWNWSIGGVAGWTIREAGVKKGTIIY